jgi:hypothetical protein
MDYEMDTKCCSESRIGSRTSREVLNGPENKIHIRQVLFRVLEKFRIISVDDQSISRRFQRSNLWAHHPGRGHMS